MTLRSFTAANPAAAAALFLLLISILTWSSCLASPLDQPDSTTELTQPELTEEIHTEKGSDRVTGTPAVTTGTCRAILPDGRLQTVVYTCAPTGYSAVVQFHKPESATHERNQTTNAPADVNAAQQHLQPITEILFLRPTTDSARVTTTESPSISAAPTKEPESTVAIVPPHRFRLESDKIRTVSLVQLQHSLPFLPVSTSSSNTTPATRRHRSTTVAAVDDDASPATTPAATRRRKTRWNIGAIQSEPAL